MAPATIAGAVLRTQNGRGAGWDRDSIIIAIQEWVATYGEPPRAADWNPSSAKWAGQLWRVERYRAGRADGSPWPALNSAKRPFDGSLIEAIRAAGFEPARPGPRRRTDVDPQQAHRAVISPEGRAMVAAALAQARDAERRVALLEARLERVDERASRAAAERDAARRAGARAVIAKPKVVRERVVDKKNVTTRPWPVPSAARRPLRRRPKRPCVRSASATPRRAWMRQRRVRRPSGWRRSSSAPRRRWQRCAASGARRETVAVLRGEARRLTAAELNELRVSGPSGPAVMAAALQALTAARRTNNPVRMQEALRRVAQAAVTWQERI